MTDRPRTSDTTTDPDHESPPRMPRWVKWSAIIVLALVLVLVGMKVAGVGMDHGPGMHSMGSR